LTHGFDVTFSVLAVLAIVGALVAAIFIEPQRRETEPIREEVVAVEEAA
jgi:hypothetical protein